MLCTKRIKKGNRRDAFTLIELLVVVSIIALLVSILMPALGRARQQAVNVQCQARQKDLGHAFMLYTTDWDGSLPPSTEKMHYPYEAGLGGTGDYGRWVARLASYYDDARQGLDGDRPTETGVYIHHYRCPVQEKYFEQDDAAVGTYGYNLYFSLPKDHPWAASGNVNSALTYRKHGKIRMPAELPLLTCLDGRPYAHPDITANADKDNDGQPDGAGGLHLKGWRGPNPRILDHGVTIAELDAKSVDGTYRRNDFGPAPNHLGERCNFLFADGHVESRGVMSLGAWPWQDDVYGRSFHPLRKPNTNLK